MSDSKYLRPYLWALARGLWSGFERTDTLVLVAIVLIFLFSWFGITEFKEHPPSWLIALSAIVLIFFEVLRAAYQLYVTERGQHEQLETERKAVLRPEQPNFAETWSSANPNEASLRLRYIRVQVRNIGGQTAAQCSAKLLKIHFHDKGGWRPLEYQDTLDMAWSNKLPRSNGEINLHPDGIDTLDVAYAVDGDPEMRIASIVSANYSGLMKSQGQYQFTFQLRSANCESRMVKLRVHWGLSTASLLFPENHLEFE
jgi:hypothetical protein